MTTTSHITMEDLLSNLESYSHGTIIEAHRTTRTKKFEFAVQIDREMGRGLEYKLWVSESHMVGWLSLCQITETLRSANPMPSDLRKIEEQ